MLSVIALESHVVCQIGERFMPQLSLVFIPRIIVGHRDCISEERIRK
jgi:hypothetical protein